MTWSCSALNKLRPAAATSGFTLIEMMVVLAILSFALALVVGYRPLWSRGFALEATAAELASQLRLVRSEAIAANRPVVLAVDLAEHRYRPGSQPVRPLPADLSLQLLTITDERLAANIGGIRFNPDGSSTGGRIVLSNGHRRIAVGVDWMTGRVSIADVK
jgi:general secretion pathway protein H